METPTKAVPVCTAHDNGRPHGGRRYWQHGQDKPAGSGVAGVKAQGLAVLVADARQDLVRLLGGDLLQQIQLVSPTPAA